jgi:hypothetical protein
MNALGFWLQTQAILSWRPTVVRVPALALLHRLTVVSLVPLDYPVSILSQPCRLREQKLSIKITVLSRAIVPPRRSKLF